MQLDFQDIAIDTRRDPISSKLIDAIDKGIVKNLKQKEFVPFHCKSDDLTVESRCILWGYRTIVPSKFRKQVLLDSHRSHMGIVKTKALARSYIWWPKLDHDIEMLVKGCMSCQLIQPNPNKSELIPWQPTQSAWSRVHVDYAGPIKGFYILVIVDSYSKWVEAFLTKSITSIYTIKKLREAFGRYGLIDTLVSDNGTQFKSSEFQKFTKMNRSDHIFTVPGHPATNGQAENSGKTTKHSIEACLREPNPDNLETILNRFLFDFRNTPHCTTGQSPAKLMFEEKSIQNHKGKRDTHFEIGKKVIIRDYSNPNKAGWVPAVIQKKLGKRHYDCNTSHSGRSIKRHLNQILDSFDPKESISTNINDQLASNEQATSDESDTSAVHEDTQISASDGDGSLYDPNATVYDSLDSTLVSTDDFNTSTCSSQRTHRNGSLR